MIGIQVMALCYENLKFHIREKQMHKNLYKSCVNYYIREIGKNWKKSIKP
ncbi:hypothetical protein QW060_04355 [Myroides ceti]|uniref:Uncharacterized protein n=1 Tax=Paenimyroides ceti TaxID=395087 RepID=A0ABT8CPW7_9FLAO|nr:hypothetical protein [Paenimyroides ceti]MDN3706355.1 hypothetical protein [Paenimyroides ceti]